MKNSSVKMAGVYFHTDESSNIRTYWTGKDS